jgi:hypothetical protein
MSGWRSTGRYTSLAVSSSLEVGVLILNDGRKDDGQLSTQGHDSMKYGHEIRTGNSDDNAVESGSKELPICKVESGSKELPISKLDSGSKE